MAWAWVRPADPTLLQSRPLLDLGTGDAALAVGTDGLVVGLDRSEWILRAVRAGRLVAGEAEALPFLSGSFAVVVAGDLFHHLDETALGVVLEEADRVLLGGGALVAWWYEKPARPGPDAPRYPRRFETVAATARTAGFARIEPLVLEFTLEPAPATVGLVASH
jgi:SAM-dependent methyltransferase